MQVRPYMRQCGIARVFAPLGWWAGFFVGCWGSAECNPRMVPNLTGKGV